MSDKTYRLFAPKTICLRCGADKKEARRTKKGCDVYGEGYPTHLWNKEEVEIEVQVVAPLEK